MHFLFLMVNSPFNYFLLINITVPVVLHLSRLKKDTKKPKQNTKRLSLVLNF